MYYIYIVKFYTCVYHIIVSNIIPFSKIIMFSLTFYLLNQIIVQEKYIFHITIEKVQ